MRQSQIGNRFSAGGLDKLTFGNCGNRGNLKMTMHKGWLWAGRVPLSSEGICNNHALCISEITSWSNNLQDKHALCSWGWRQVMTLGGKFTVRRGVNHPPLVNWSLHGFRDRTFLCRNWWTLLITNIGTIGDLLSIDDDYCHQLLGF